MLLLGAQTWLCPQRLGNCKMLQLWLPRQKGTPCVEYLSFSVYVMGTLPRLSHIILTITPGGKYSYFSLVTDEENEAQEVTLPRTCF
jgi:hypothetical protein